MEFSGTILENWICIISKKGDQCQLPNRFLVDWLCEEDMSDQRVSRKETNPKHSASEVHQCQRQ